MTIFDIIGPVMIGPSSSHTAGAARLGYMAHHLLGETPVRAQITLSGSFALTHRGHGTDQALTAGILGLLPDDVRIRDSLALARQRGLQLEFEERDLPNTHPNTARIQLQGAAGGCCTLQGASVGGGNILVTQVDGMEVCFTGQNDTLLVLHRDKPGTIAAVTERLSQEGVNIGNFRLSRLQKGGEALMTIEADGALPQEARSALAALPNILKVVLIHAI